MGSPRPVEPPFDAEYDAHRALSPLRGFPRLYGRGRVGEDSVIVMEWVEGVTLEEAARALAVDDEGAALAAYGGPHRTRPVRSSGSYGLC